MPRIWRPGRGPFRKPRTLVKIQDLQPIAGSSDSGQGSQSVDAVALLSFIASAVSGQGAQSGAAQASLDFIGAVVAGQGSQSVGAVALEQLIASIAAAQGSQTADVAAQLIFLAPASSAQGSETVDGVAAEIFAASAITGQGGQTVDAIDAPVVDGTVESGQGAQSALGVASTDENLQGGAFMWTPSVPVRRFVVPKKKKADAVTGIAASAQGGHRAEGQGRVIQRIEGAAVVAQVAAEVIAIGVVDNRRPMNIRKAQVAAALLLAA